MTMNDLPDDWGDRPITRERAADVADLFAFEEQREAGGLVLLLLDRDGRLRVPVRVDGIPAGAPPTGKEDGFLGGLGDLLERSGGSLVLVRCRPGRAHLDDADRAWHELVLRAVGAPNVLAAFLATPGRVTAFPPPLAEVHLTA